MAEEVEVRFEREGVEGVVPVGIYLLDTAKRLGIRFEDDCIPAADVHYCAVVIKTGADLISSETGAESRHFQKAGRRKNERLACQAKIERTGEVVIMTEEKVSEAASSTEQAEDMNEQYRKQFADMPLEKKIANLVHLETMALGETISFIINSPFMVADKIMDVMAEFGFKKEEREKSAARPVEHTNGDSASNGAKDSSAESPIAAEGSEDPPSGNKSKATGADTSTT